MLTHFLLLERRRRSTPLTQASARLRPSAFSLPQAGLSVADFRSQGDASLGTGDALAARGALRREPGVARWLARWHAAHQSARPADGALAKHEMLAVQLRMCKALFASAEFDEADIAAACEEEWAKEAGGGDHMPKAIERPLDAVCLWRLLVSW